MLGSRAGNSQAITLSWYMFKGRKQVMTLALGMMVQGQTTGYDLDHYDARIKAVNRL